MTSQLQQTDQTHRRRLAVSKAVGNVLGTASTGKCQGWRWQKTVFHLKFPQVLRLRTSPDAVTAPSSELLGPVLELR